MEASYPSVRPDSRIILRARSRIFHWLAHLQHGDVAAGLRDQRGLEDELHRLGDGHEVARHIFVRHRERLAILNLLPEDRDHATRASEHIPEPDDVPVGAGVAPGERQDEQLRQSLGGAHDGRRADGLVRGDKNELLGARLCGHLRHLPGAQDVVANALSDVALHHGDVLVGGGVEDPVGALLSEHHPHLFSI